MKPALSPAVDPANPGDTGALAEAARRAEAYVREIRGRRVAPTADAVRELEQLAGALPEEPTAPGAVVEMLDRFGSAATVGLGGGRYFGFVNGSFYRHRSQPAGSPPRGGRTPPCG